MTRSYGWHPDSIDPRDHAYIAPPRTTPLPASVDLRTTGFMPAVVDQGQLGSCTANAIAGAHHYDQLAQHENAFAPSRLFIYYNERAVEGTVNEDAGAIIRDGIKVVGALGVCDETTWPYNIAKFTKRPTRKARCAALKHKAVTYQRVPQTLDGIRGVLAAGRPMVFGFKVYASFESVQTARTGIMPMPVAGEQVLGGHAVLAVGYDDQRQAILVRNSWGTGWGLLGYFWMPYAYITTPSLASDFWVISVVQ